MSWPRGKEENPASHTRIKPLCINNIQNLIRSKTNEKPLRHHPYPPEQSDRFFVQHLRLRNDPGQPQYLKSMFEHLYHRTSGMTNPLMLRKESVRHFHILTMVMRG